MSILSLEGKHGQLQGQGELFVVTFVVLPVQVLFLLTEAAELHGAGCELGAGLGGTQDKVSSGLGPPKTPWSLLDLWFSLLQAGVFSLSAFSWWDLCSAPGSSETLSLHEHVVPSPGFLLGPCQCSSLS